MTLHEFIILMTLPLGTSGYNEIQMILPIGTSGYNIRYTSEYILKFSNTSTLPLNQEGILLTQFISTSIRHWIIIKAKSSLDHQQNWIIIKARSSLDHHHHCFHYLDQLVLSLNSTRHRKLYRANPFSCWLQAYPPRRSSSSLVLISDHGRPSLPPCPKGMTNTYI